MIVYRGAALVAALAAVSCSSPGPLSAADFTAEANAICTEANAQVAAIAAPDPADPELVANAISQIVVVQRAAAEELADLRPPENRELQVGEWLDRVGDVIDEEESVAQAVTGGDPAAADAANAAAAAANAEAEALATDLGLDACVVAPPFPMAPDVPPTGVPPAPPGESTTTVPPPAT